MRNCPGGSLADNLTWQALSFMRCEWPFLFSGDNRLRARTFESAVSHLVRTDGDVLLSYADVVADQVTVAGEPISVLGLSNVFTFPPYRNEGHASEIVNAAGRQIDASGVNLALLFCEEWLEPFYRARGWLPDLRAACGREFRFQAPWCGRFPDAVPRSSAPWPASLSW